MNAQTGPGEAPQMPKAPSVPAAQEPSQPEQPDPPPVVGLIEIEQPAEEPAAPMDNAPHVHAPQGGIHNWRDFFVHIAVVAIGLLLAIGLEQAVEAVHHAHQREQLEEQMRETFEANALDIAENVQVLNDFRAYLTDVQASVAARLNGRSAPPPPAVTDPRNFTRAAPPDLGPYEAAKANGSVAFLSLERIRIYNYTEFQYGLMERNFLSFLDALAALRAFRQRFESSPDIPFAIMAPDLATLSIAQLTEYQALIATTLQATSIYAAQMQRVDRGTQAVLDGAQDASEVREAILGIARDNRANAPALPAGHETGATTIGGSHD